MKSGPIPAIWVVWTRRMDATHLIAVKEELEARGQEPTEENVRAVSRDIQFAAEAAGPKFKFERRRK